MSGLRAPHQTARTATNGAVPATSAPAELPRALRTLAIFHLAEVTGPSKSLRPRLAALAERGRLEVVAPSDGPVAASYGELGPVRSLPYESLTVPRSPAEAVRALRRLGREVRLFRRELRRARPEVVIVVTAVLPAALIAARLEGLPTIVYVGEIFDKRHRDGRLRALGSRAIAALTEALADRLVCCSETVAAQFRRRTPKVIVVYPGIDPSHAGGDGSAFRAEHGLEDARPLIAVLGNLSEGRGQDLAIRALPALRARLPGARLVLAGAPHPRANDHAFAHGLRGLAERLGVAEAVSFTGFVERVADVYAAADVVVNPARFNEPFGRVALEALLAGRPVVASSVGAIPEVLRDGRDALLVPPDDPAALAEAMARAVEEPELRRRLVQKGQARVREWFGEERGVAAFEGVVSELLAERAAERSRSRTAIVR